MSERDVYLIDGARTPFLKARGAPGPFTPVDLAVQCGRPLLLRQPFAADAFDQVILGCVSVIADEANPARVAALRLGCGTQMPAFTVQINCGSGMQSVDVARRYIADGRADLVLAGGAEAHGKARQAQAGVRTALWQGDARQQRADPVGSSGARILLHLANAMERLGKRTGIATECIGGGQGGAMLVERIEGSAA